MTISPFGTGEGGNRGDPPLAQIIEVMRRHHGRDLASFDECFLARSLHKRLAPTATGAWAAYVERLPHDRAEAEALFESLNIGHSEFFRNPLTYALLEQWILPGLVEAKAAAGAELRVWSAGCAAGQEAWSIAMLLEDLAAARGRPVPTRIIATDASEQALALARRGFYLHRAVQNLRVRHLGEYFTPSAGGHVVSPRLRGSVSFSNYDMLDEHSVCPPTSLYGDFDLIFCCNLLFYYRPEVRRAILDKIGRALLPGGYFVTGEAEREFVSAHGGFSAVFPASTVFQQGDGPEMKTSPDHEEHPTEE